MSHIVLLEAQITAGATFCPPFLEIDSNTLVLVINTSRYCFFNIQRSGILHRLLLWELYTVFVTLLTTCWKFVLL